MAASLRRDRRQAGSHQAGTVPALTPRRRLTQAIGFASPVTLRPSHNPMAAPASNQPNACSMR